MDKVELYADGACLGNPGRGGWGVVLECGAVKKSFSGTIAEHPTTNMRAELIAIIEGLRLLKRPCQVTIYSDSQVTIRCITGEYGRKANGDLWAAYERMVSAGGHSITAQWVKGHNGNLYNEQAHKLAEQAAQS